MSHTYVLSWDCTGLEAVVNISDIEKEAMWSALKDPDNEKSRGRSVNQIVHMLTLRARFNTQRHYEIYCIDTDDTITEEDLRRQFDDNPQGMADLIRDRGRQLYSDRVKPNEVKIR